MIPALSIGRWTMLLPACASDSDWIYRFCCSADTSQTFRLGGATPSPDSLRRFLTFGTYVNSVVWTRDQSDRIGVAQLYNVDWRNKHGWVAFALADRYRQSGWAMESILLLISYAFGKLGLEKIYFEPTPATMATYGSSIGRWLEREGPEGGGVMALSLSRRVFEESPASVLLSGA